ncbi:DUF1993 domain-containing protein [Erythrobacter sp. SDW2]|uniref:DUF1993 domain-containing protein n=1 Tax=Erythrobacter sp. SDW2 TaxID=2907154 RepID=UPI001F3B4337|nr:DUF1993 domain-containing protein [Erythrobacter sp. SDW2]UIP06170.1 DUF1993 domain-containing protein [Erythrobacter sp. SDW2]
MALTLYDAFVPSCRQILGGMHGVIAKAEAHCTEHGIDPAELVEAKLADTMWNLPWHVRSTWVHSAYVISLLPTGEFSPDFTELPGDFSAMKTKIQRTLDELAQVTPEQLEEVQDKTVGFVLGGQRLMEFSGQNFLLGFSQPNFYFHATTFYDILRMKGVPLGKRDFMGNPMAR